MPKAEVTPSLALVAAGRWARFMVVFLDNGGNRVGPDSAAQVTPKLVSGKGQFGETSMKKEGAVFSFRPFSQYCVIEVGGTGVMDPPRVEVRADTSISVMPNSVFEGVVMAGEAPSEASDSVVPETAAGVRTALELGGAWKYRADISADTAFGDANFFRPEFDDSEWAAMKVPSNFVLEDKSLQDFYGPVWFRRRFKLDQKTRAAQKRFKLRFEGVDYFARVYLNGMLLGSHEGYFNPFEFDITERLADGENLLAVRVVNPNDDGIASADQEGNVSACEKVWIKGILSYHDTRPGSIELSAKDCQTQGTGGIVGAVKIVGHGPATIDWVRVDIAIEGEDAARTAVVTARHFCFNHGNDEFAAVLGAAATGEGFDQKAFAARAVKLPPGPSYVDIEIRIADPRLWWPWSHPELGRPDLYNLRSALFAPGAATVSDSVSTTFGVRTIAMSETGERAWLWSLNGKRIFFRGTNVIPTIWLSRMDEGSAKRDISLLKKAHLDGMIVLDHHQPPVFYQAADREGMPVFQEFTLVWEYSVARHLRDNGDPALLSNVEVMKRMLAEALMLYHNHPSILWWSLHDEPFFTFGQFDAGESEIPDEPFAPGQKMRLLMDRSFNRGLDAALAGVAAAFDPRRPWHASGNEGTNSTQYWGWYNGVHTDATSRKEPFPIEFGAQAVPYSAEEFMLRRHGKEIWPPADEAAYRRWMFHCLQYPYLSAHIGRTSRYKEFAHWAFASQIHQAAVVKYNIERFRANRYNPTGSEFYFLFSSWWPSITWGTLDHNREPTTAYRWLCDFNNPVAVIADPGKGVLPGGRVEVPVCLVNDLHTPVQAVLEWSVRETAGSFVLRTEPDGVNEGFSNPLWNKEFPDEVIVLDKCGATLRTAASGQATFDVGPDLVSLPKPVAFDLPQFEGTPRHFSLELDLRDPQGKPLARNAYQFCVAGPDPKAVFAPGLSPAPAFKLSVSPSNDPRSAGPQRVHVVHKYSGRQVMGGVMFGGDGRTVKDLPPGIYVLRFTFKGKEIVRDILLDRDVSVELDI
jgi:beta-mannosidase